jgi:hypothetical protein
MTQGEGLVRWATFRLRVCRSRRSDSDNGRMPHPLPPLGDDHFDRLSRFLDLEAEAEREQAART